MTTQPDASADDLITALANISRVVDDNIKIRARLGAARYLHRSADTATGPICEHCSTAWPCRTIQVIGASPND